jgi:hypothetical protein
MSRLKLTKVVLLISVFISLAGHSQDRGSGPGSDSMNNSIGDSMYISTKDAGVKYKQIWKQPFYVFPERREAPLVWYDSLRVSHLSGDYSVSPFVLKAHPGEYFVYQVGVWATNTGLEGVEAVFSDLTDESRNDESGKGGSGKVIRSGSMTCFNSGGIDYKGRPFKKTISVAEGRVQALWIGVDLSKVGQGSYQGTVTVVVNKKKKLIKLRIDVAGEFIPDLGFDEGKRLSRMAWLNDTIGIDDHITKGFLPVRRNGDELSILGRSFKIAPDGLPAAITSYFTPSNQGIREKGEPVINTPFRFVIERENGGPVVLKSDPMKITGHAPGFVSWEVRSHSPECELICSGRLEYDGHVEYRLRLKSLKTLPIKDIRLEIPMNKSKAGYMMGLNREGGIFPGRWEWKWDTTRNQDALWLGGVNGGLRIKLKDENYRLPLVNVYYEFGRLHTPASWGNDTKGGVTVSKEGEDVVIDAYSGSRQLKAGTVCNYNFELLITPFKTIDNAVKYGDRYYHGGGTESFSKIDKAKGAGANIINIHQAESLYPFINYPYQDDNTADLKKLVDQAHADSLRLKLYYTTREITKNMPEFFPFYSLNGEVIYPGPGNASRTVLYPNGPNEWLVKNLREKYIPAWYDPIKSGKFKGVVDLSVITTPESRMNNFYIGGLDWMLKHLGIDGVYIDDAAIDRFTIRRARKLIDGYRPAGRMDMHSWNHFNKWAGYASCLNLYMDLLPYLDLVWIGEGRDYNRMPDHWLVEVSGIPFGLMGQMLEGGGNPWRGMIYGITNRAGWSGNPPSEIWKFWDKYSIGGKELVGYWQPDCPVTVNNDSVRASIFKGDAESIIAIANWSKEEQTTSVAIDWSALKYNPSSSTISIPSITGFQDEELQQSLSSITIPGGKGYLIVIKNGK